MRPENEGSIHRATTHTDQGIALRLVALRRCVSNKKKSLELSSGKETRRI